MKQAHTIGIFSTPSQAGRYRLAGALHYIAARPDLQPVIVTLGAPSPARARSILTKHRADGLLVWSSAVMAAIGEKPPGVPVVSAVDPGRFRADAVLELDERSIVVSAAELALRRGFRHFAYFGSPYQNDLPRSQLRRRLFAERLAQAGFDCSAYHPRRLFDTMVRRDEPRPEIVAWLEGLPRPCFVLAYCDNRAYTLVNVCRAVGLSVPEQISIVGIDNQVELCENANPSLTSVWPDFEQCGFLAAQTLHNILRNGRPRRPLRLDYGLKDIVERNSTLDQRGGGRLVSQALETLRSDYANVRLGVPSLARSLNVSRQLLDLRFREILGHSAHAELERIRLDRARQLLANTDLPIGEVVSRCGYNSANAFRHAFASVADVSPRQWRMSQQDCPMGTDPIFSSLGGLPAISRQSHGMTTKRTPTD